MHLITNYKEYKYKGLTHNMEGDIIGYALFKPGYIKEDLTEIDNECIGVYLNSEPLKDIAAIKHITEDCFITSVHYSKYGNYLGDEEKWFTPVDIDKVFKG